MNTNWPVGLPLAIGTLAHEWLVETCLVTALFVVTPVSALSQAVSPWQPVVVASDRGGTSNAKPQSNSGGNRCRVWSFCHA